MPFLTLLFEIFVKKGTVLKKRHRVKKSIKKAHRVYIYDILKYNIITYKFIRKLLKNRIFVTLQCKFWVFLKRNENIWVQFLPRPGKIPFSLPFIKKAITSTVFSKYSYNIIIFYRIKLFSLFTMFFLTFPGALFGMGSIVCAFFSDEANIMALFSFILF